MSIATHSLPEKPGLCHLAGMPTPEEEEAELVGVLREIFGAEVPIVLEKNDPEWTARKIPMQR